MQSIVAQQVEELELFNKALKQELLHTRQQLSSALASLTFEKKEKGKRKKRNT